MKKLIGLLFLLNALAAISQPERLSRYNLDHFSKREKVFSNEFSKLIPEKDLNHPDLGIMPFNTPPGKNYIELVNRRDAFSRYFVEKNSNGSSFIQAQAYSPINYQDQNGFWREINYRLEKKQEGLFYADNQPNPIRIDLKNGIISLKRGDNIIEAGIPLLAIRDENGIGHSFGASNINNYSAGDDGIIIHNFYQGIDLVITVHESSIETSFVLNQRLAYQTGEIVLNQSINHSKKLNLIPEKTTLAQHQEIYLTDENSNPYYIIGRGFALDNNLHSTPLKLKSKIVDQNNFEFQVPVAWLNDPGTQYPVIIDPVIWTQNSVALATITGTKFSAVCWTNSCDYIMAVPTPANATITGIYHSFEFYATGLCFAEDGGYSIDFLACHAPSAAPGVFTNPIHISNAYFTADTVLLNEFNTCIPNPQCASQNLNFTLHFFRCNNDPDPTCSANCIRATKPWVMYIKGETVTVSSITSAQQVCEGASAEMVASAQFGVGPYTYSWAPAPSSIDTLTVTAAATTTYTVTITDACAVTATATSQLNVTANNNPGFAISPNPACVSALITLTGNGAGAPSDYDWLVPGSTSPGGIVNDNQAPVIDYSLPGTFEVTLSYANGTCTFLDSASVTINSQSAASVSLSANPSGAICLGDTVSFLATPTNGGPTPNYEWLIDGVSVQNGGVDSLVTSALNNGSLVQVVMSTSLACTTPATDTSSLFISVGNAITPSVVISPDTSVCSGSPITLTASPANGGTTPAYQWFANGVPVPGATSSTYTFNVTPPDTIIGVVINSSLSCVTAAAAGDTSIINILQNVSALVTITANPAGTICAGDSVHYTAHAVNGGTLPQFSWYLNGVLTAITDSVYSIIPVDNDSISVSLTSSLTCAVVNIDDDYTIADVSPAVSPSVTISAAPSTTICTGDTVTFTASQLNAGGTPTYAWTINGNPVGINDSILISSTLNDNDVVQVILTSSLTCAPVSSDTDQVTITVVGNVTPNVTVSVNGNAVCEGDSIQFIASTTTGGSTPSYQWLVNGAATGLTTDTIILTNLHNGDTVQTVMTSSLGCVSPSSVTSFPYISNLQPYVTPQISISSSPPDSICQGQLVTLTAATQYGGTTPSIQWYINNQPTGITSNSFSSDTFNQGDIIVANLFSNANCLLQNSDTSNFVRIYFHPPLGVQLIPDSPYCPGFPTLIVAHVTGGNGGPYNLSWSNGITGTDSVVVSPGPNTQLIVRADDNCTVQFATDTMIVPVLLGPTAEFSYVNASPGSFQNTVQFTNLSYDFNTYSWLFSDSGNTSTEYNPLKEFPGPGIYPVTLYTQNNNGCVDSITYEVIVREDEAIYYPNSFSPNGDGKNDFFSPIGESLENYQMTIWNRWGELIFTGSETKPWNGMVNNSVRPAPDDVYVFMIDLMSEQYEKRVVTGRVTLIR